MSQRYGSTYSPDPKPDHQAPPPKRPFDGKRPSRVGARSNLLFFAALPLAWKAFQSEPVVMSGYLAALGCLLGAAFLTREGLKAEEAYEARKVARRPSIPRKLFGSVLTGIGLGLVGWFGWGSVETVLFAVLGVVLHSFAFGLDPMKSKGMEGIDTFQQDRVARAVDEAEKHLAAMRDAVKRTNDRQVERRVDDFVATARDMFRTIEEDPRDLTAARKYLGVYLLGARDATSKFADIYVRSRDAEARAKWVALLDDLERNFTARTESLLLDDKTGLDIEIDVLRERLAREGIKR
ncbi:5-bromo-4-chloroindolyl phosphate hydrolysis family protein [Celeribacter arenosi]|uniref:5-bromo-4-chloroindolyl phosphate hydrolysis family protein n=1 Tax=Celeribacter arenosi TaxID=792649 RepID=A0ABP7JS67_9RHOB